MFAFLLAFPLWAQVVAVSTPNTNPLDYENHLLQNPSQISFLQHYGKQRKQTSDDLFAKLKRAQFYFLDGQLSLAKESFDEITSMAHSADWGEEERKALHFSFLRKAQLTSNVQTSYKILGQALDFDFEQIIDEQIFPPPLVQQYKNLLKQRKSLVFALPSQASKFDQILINGKVQTDVKSFLKIPRQDVRITFLSNTYKPQSFVTNSEQLQNLKISLDPLILGTCESPDWDRNLFADQKILRIWPGCQNSKSLALPTLSEKLTIRPEVSSSNFKFLKSKWFWAGVSILATGAIVHHQQKDRSSAHQGSEVQTPQVTILSNR